MDATKRCNEEKSKRCNDLTESFQDGERKRARQ